MDAKLVMLISAGKNRYKSVAVRAVTQFIRVGMPVRLTEAAFLNQQLVEGHTLQDRKIGFCDRRTGTVRRRVPRFYFSQRNFVNRHQPYGYHFQEVSGNRVLDSIEGVRLLHDHKF